MCDILIPDVADVNDSVAVTATNGLLIMVKSQLRSLIAQKEQQENRRLSLREIQAATKISYSSLSRLANGHMSRFDIALLDALCEYFNCDVGDILQYAPDKR